MRLALKTGTYAITHVAVATAVAYALTGNMAAAIGIGLIEPIIQTGVFTVHEMIWESGRDRAQQHRARQQDAAAAHPAMAAV